MSVKVSGDQACVKAPTSEGTVELADKEGSVHWWFVEKKEKKNPILKIGICPTKKKIKSNLETSKKKRSFVRTHIQESVYSLFISIRPGRWTTVQWAAQQHTKMYLK